MVIGKYDAMTSRDAIMRLEQVLIEQPQVDIPAQHDFCNGLYSRTIRIPPGVIATGAIHREESFFIVRSGQLLVTTDEGVIHVGPGFMAVTKPGQKRAVLALTECEVTNIHPNPTNEQNQEVLWSMMTVGLNELEGGQ